MHETTNSNGTDSPSVDNPRPPEVAQPSPSPLQKIFKGPYGLRAGWRVLIYLAIGSALLFLIISVIHHLRGSHTRKANLDSPVPTMIGEWISFTVFGLTAWIMSRIEKQPWSNYGLPVRQAFRKHFWLGGLFGFAGLSCVMGFLWITHCYHIDGLALHGPEIAKFAGLWLLAFVGVGMFEEFLFRGYAQYTLASGMGFWSAALLTSALFTIVHRSNPGETLLGLTDVFLFGIIACFMWWRTGSMWLAVGFHGFWDWGLSYFYSVPDSGVPALGHLFNTRVQGPAWLSGGTAGPEGSAINIVFDVIWIAIIAWLFPRVKFAAMQERRPISTVPTPQNTVIDSSALSG
jgi:uncharacterized protein